MTEIMFAMYMKSEMMMDVEIIIRLFQVLRMKVGNIHVW